MKPRSVKVPDDLWADAHEAARREGESLSVVIRRFLREYVARMRDAA